MKFYCHPRCSTCKKAQTWLDENHISYEWVDITEETPDARLIQKMIEESDRTAKSFFNTSGKVYREGGYKEKVDYMSPEEMAKALAADGMLIKRPFATDGKVATSGFKEAEYEKYWKG